MLPKVSIVIPVFNGSNYLDDAIQSALAQTYPNIEVMVVNDGSCDDGASERIALGYGTRLRYFHKTNGHVASALNFAIERMSGEYFSWLSHDDLYAPDKVAVQVKMLRGMDDRTVVYSDFEILDEATGKRVPVRLQDVPPEHFRLELTRSNSLHGCTLLIPRSAFDECGLFDESLRTTQDYDMWFRIAGRFRFLRAPHILVTGRQHADQGSRKLQGIALRECDELLSGFVSALSTDELRGMHTNRVWAAYLRLADNLRKRGFTGAAETAARKAVEAVQGEGWLSKVGCRVAAACLR